jgi:demethylmenaquinone methyltransferase/2-methoxy-6-polyprenyl-1,4-benzoquinol methylase
VTLGDAQETADQQPASDREREPGSDRDHEKDDPLRHRLTLGIGSDGHVLKSTCSTLAPHPPSCRESFSLDGPYTRGVAVASSRRQHAQRLFAPLGPTYDRYARLLSFGQDPRWRRFLVSRIAAAPGETVLDVATGTGAVARELIRQKQCMVVGVDQSPQMLGVARRRVPPAVDLVEGDAEHLPFPDETFDALTFTYLFRYVDDPAATLRELARVVKPGGTIGGLEFFVPPNPVAHFLWRRWVGLGLPLAGRLIAPGWGEVGDFLGPSIEELWRRIPVERLLDLWGDAGIEDVRFRRLSLGGGIVIWGRRQ